MNKKSQILIVDDDQIVCKVLEKFLHPDGYDITVANSASDALKNLQTFTQDTILLDVMMDDMDGFELCRKIKAENKWQHIPVILVTGLNGKDDIVRGLDSGADDFLHKPVNGHELRARVRSALRVKKLIDELQETIQLREDMSYMIMHDMQNPLSAVMMASQLLQLNINTPQELRYIDTIFNQTQRLESFMNDMLMLAKMKAGKLVLNRTNVEINSFIQKIAGSHYATLESRNLTLSLALLEDPFEVSIDKTIFERVLDNLMSNAIKFSPNDSAITLKLEKLNSAADSELKTGIRIKVLDEGYGIKEEHKNNIFDKFKVAPLKREGVPQLGLGLAFCKMVVEAHKGKIFVENNKPKGSIFVIEI
ncbi:MAG: hybrid sensor histidine kinase/response regulator [Candidatus Anammoxibacter sp.]